MKFQIVIGLGYGDEGKGLTTSTLVAKAQANGEKPAVVRFNGGHQAGHTVVVDDVSHVFSTYGSGTLQGAPTVITSDCVVYPTALVNEYDVLRPKLREEPVLIIDPETPICTPMDVNRNQIEEDRRDIKHGSVGVGFGTTLQREEDHYHLFARDLFYPTILFQKLQTIMGDYNDTVRAQFIADIERMRKLIVLKPSAMFGFDTLIFEGAQGLMLDQTYGFYPHVTRSNTGVKNILKLLENDTSLMEVFTRNAEIFYVTRTYATRHGNGPTIFKPGVELKNNQNETNVTNKYQGEFITGVLNVDLLNYALECDEYESKGIKRSLMLTCMDQYELDVDQLLVQLAPEFNEVLVSKGPSYADVQNHTR